MQVAATVASPALISSGLPGVGQVSWGTHLCHFYQTPEDLRDALVPYFQAGLLSGEQCLWVTSEPFSATSARAALAEVVPELGDYERSGQLQIIDFEEWYAVAGTMDSDAVMRAWLDREEQALAAGFKGLRLTGNTFWLEREDWAEFSQYEAAVHDLFHDRHILALCSYSLERCSIDDVLDVMSNHEFALLRRDGAWEVIHTATQLLSAVQSVAPAPCPEHLVQFYSDEQYPADAIAAFLRDGLRAGGPAAVIATRPHLDAIRAALTAFRVDGDRVQLHDADEIIARCSRDDRLDLRVFDESIKGFLAALPAGATDQSRPHVYGEIVDLLCRRGDAATAVEVERLWNLHLRAQQVALYCGYELSNFGADEQAFLAVCGAHSNVRADGSSGDQHLVARALTHELGRRRAFEAERNQLLAASRDSADRLARLQRMTSALAEVTVPAELEQVIDHDLCPLLGASRAFMTIASDQGSELVASAPADASAELVDGDLVFPMCAQQASAEAHRTGVGVWLRDRDHIHATYPDVRPTLKSLVALPLIVGRRKIGAMAFGFAQAQSFDTAQRALIKDLARQAAMTLERAQLYEISEQQRREAEEASLAKDDFLAMLGHELRNPLTVIRTAAELMKATGQSGRIQEALERQSNHMAKLIDGLLDVSRITRGKIELEMAPADLCELIRETADDHRSQIEDRGLVLRLDLAESLPLQGDRVRLVQVIDNLVSNSIKFTDAPGAITLIARRDGEEALLEVRDEGHGIEAELLPHIFEPFRQAAQGLARESGGLGLGLAVVKRLVELHGGTIVAASDGPGLGATFRVRLPL